MDLASNTSRLLAALTVIGGLSYPAESATWKLCRNLSNFQVECKLGCIHGRTLRKLPTRAACEAARAGNERASSDAAASQGKAGTATQKKAKDSAQAMAAAEAKATAAATALAQRQAEEAAALKKAKADAAKAEAAAIALEKKESEAAASAQLLVEKDAAVKAMVEANSLLPTMAAGGLRRTVEDGIAKVADALEANSAEALRTETDALTRLTAQIAAAQSDQAEGVPEAKPALGATVPPQKRVALVIGNSAYRYAALLPNPANDAADVSAALVRLGFAVRRVENQGRNDLRDALAEFSNAALGADVALVFYAGHGIEVDRLNYLIPVDARLETDLRIRFEAIPLDDVMAALEGVKGLRLVLLDACRNNPFAASMRVTAATRSIGRGLSRVEPQVGTLVSFAAKEGTTAADGKARNSPYTTALLAHIEEKGVEVNKLFRLVRDRVLAATAGQQEPYTYGSTPAVDIYLKP
jgi:hypothetical protein